MNLGGESEPLLPLPFYIYYKYWFLYNPELLFLFCYSSISMRFFSSDVPRACLSKSRSFYSISLCVKSFLFGSILNVWL